MKSALDTTEEERLRAYEWYHTGLWPHEGVDFAGLRVGVIGTGSSGVQSVLEAIGNPCYLVIFRDRSGEIGLLRSVP